MDKYNYSNLQKLNKDELIYIMCIMEKDIRREYELFTVPPVEMYHMIKDLFKKRNNLNPLPHSEMLNELISFNIKNMSLNPVTLKFEIHNEIDKDFDRGEEEEWLKTISNWESNILDNVKVKQVICINGSGINDDERSKAVEAQDEDLRCRMIVENNKITVKNIIEMIYRIKGSKYDTWYELFSNMLSHIDAHGTLFLEIEFDHGS